MLQEPPTGGFFWFIVLLFIGNGNIVQRLLINEGLKVTDQVAGLKAEYIRKILELQGDMPGYEYAKVLGITHARLSNLRKGHTFGFSLDAVMRMVLAAGGEL